MSYLTFFSVHLAGWLSPRAVSILKKKKKGERNKQCWVPRYNLLFGWGVRIAWHGLILDQLLVLQKDGDGRDAILNKQSVCNYLVLKVKRVLQHQLEPFLVEIVLQHWLQPSLVCWCESQWTAQGKFNWHSYWHASKYVKVLLQQQVLPCPGAGYCHLLRWQSTVCLLCF